MRMTRDSNDPGKGSLWALNPAMDIASMLSGTGSGKRTVSPKPKKRVPKSEKKQFKKAKVKAKTGEE